MRVSSFLGPRGPLVLPLVDPIACPQEKSGSLREPVKNYRVSQKKFKIEFFEVRQLWALSGHFWMLWTLFDIFGHSGHPGHFFGILGTVGHFWALWALLGTLGTFVHSGHFWELLGTVGTFEHFWALLATLGTFGHF